jgi:hypothetical protein
MHCIVTNSPQKSSALGSERSSAMVLLVCGQPAFSNIVKRACCSHRENRARITTRFRRHKPAVRMMTEHFSIRRETAAAVLAGRAWTEENLTHPGVLNVRDFAQRGRDFSEYRPALLPELLGLHTEAWSAWWARWGTDQQPSHSFTQAFCLAVAAAALPSGVAIGRAPVVAGTHGVSEVAAQ